MLVAPAFGVSEPGFCMRAEILSWTPLVVVKQSPPSLLRRLGHRSAFLVPSRGWLQSWSVRLHLFKASWAPPRAAAEPRPLRAVSTLQCRGGVVRGGSHSLSKGATAYQLVLAAYRVTGADLLGLCWSFILSFFLLEEVGVQEGPRLSDCISNLEFKGLMS